MRLDHIEITSIGYAGAGCLDQTNSKAMIETVSAPLRTIMTAETTPASVKGYIAQLFDPSRMQVLLNTPPDATEAGPRPGTYMMPAAGACMSPKIDDMASLEIDSVATITAGDTVMYVSTYAFWPKIAMYLGRQAIDDRLHWYARQPETLHLFFQRDPLTILAVADYDLVAMARVANVELWAFDVREHRDLQPTFSTIVAETYQPEPGPNLPMAAWQETRRYFLALEALLISEGKRCAA